MASNFNDWSDQVSHCEILRTRPGGGSGSSSQASEASVSAKESSALRLWSTTTRGRSVPRKAMAGWFPNREQNVARVRTNHMVEDQRVGIQHYHTTVLHGRCGGCMTLSATAFKVVGLRPKIESTGGCWPERHSGMVQSLVVMYHTINRMQHRIKTLPVGNLMHFREINY